MEHSPQLSSERPCDDETLNVTSIEEPSPELIQPFNDGPPTAASNIEGTEEGNVDPAVDDDQMDVSASPLHTTPMEPAVEQMDESFPTLVTSSEEPAPKHFESCRENTSSSKTTSSSDSDSSSTSDDSSSEDSDSTVIPSPDVPITEAQATESANKNDQNLVAPAEGEQSTQESATGEGLAEAITSLVKAASLRPPSPVA
ncbi:hypothetical protein TELCIR_23768, partial [Teladorsagia circumcincta]